MQLVQNSIGEAFKIIQRGDADAMITGGTEAPITHMALAGFSASRALSTNDDKSSLSSIPKVEMASLWREGAGILVIESLESAQARGAQIYAEIVGYGSTGDAYHAAPLLKVKVVHAMQAALDDAGIEAKMFNILMHMAQVHCR